MKIICTVTNDLRQDQRMDRICTSLTEAGHEVTLVGREKSDSLPLPERSYAQVRLPMRFQKGKLFYLEYNWKLRRWLRRQPCDAINSIDLDTLLAGFLGRKGNTKLVFDAHEYFSETPEVVDRPLVQTIWRKLARWLIPKANLCYTVGPELAKIFRRKYGVDFGVVRNLPIPAPEITRPPFPEDAPKIILYQGMLNRGRGLETIIKAMERLPHDCQLWLVGKGDVEEELRRCSAQSRAAARIVFKGFVPPEELPALTQQAWLGLNLLEATSPSYYYSLANKAFDYLQAGLPSIQMGFPEYRNLEQQYHCFRLLPELHPQKLANLIIDLRNNPNEYQRLSQNCRRAAAELHWRREEQVLLGLWDSL